MSGRKNRETRPSPPPQKVPNKATVEALRQSRDGKDLEEFDSLEELKASFE